MALNNPVTLQIYLTRLEKQAFKNACYQADTEMSRELRRFIRAFIKNPPKSDVLNLSNLSNMDITFPGKRPGKD